MYGTWPPPTVIVSDGGYGVLGFNGDTVDHRGLPSWYEPHIAAWSKYALPQTTLWFWNSEVGWAVVHPLLEQYGWRYVELNVWDKGKAHVAGNVNTQTLRRLPVTTEVCALYVRDNKIQGLTLREWLLHEWHRSGLPLSKTNEACEVKNAATRKYFTKDHLWYFPPADAFEKLVRYANVHGQPSGRPYFSVDGVKPMSKDEWAQMRSKFSCPYGWSNVWRRPPVHGKERIRGLNGKSAHLNQKPLDLLRMAIQASSDEGDVVWEPFGGLYSASIAAAQLKRRAFGAEIVPEYHAAGARRFLLTMALQELTAPVSP